MADVQITTQKLFELIGRLYAETVGRAENEARLVSVIQQFNNTLDPARQSTEVAEMAEQPKGKK